MKRVIFNRKGGVGKSSVAVNLAAIFARRGRKTLLVDLDPQCNATRYLLGDVAKDISPNLADYFSKTLDFQFQPIPDSSYVHETPFDNLFVMPANAEVLELQSKLESRHKIYKLRDTLNTLYEEFDEIIIDTPPAYNFFSQSALIAADLVLIPFDCDDFSRQALYAVFDNVKEIVADHNAGLKVEGIVVNQFTPRAKLPQRLVDELIEEGLPVMTARLSHSIKMRESHDMNIPLIHLDSRHKLTLEFVELHDELLVA